MRYYANGGRFELGMTISDRLFLRMLYARDEWDVLSILITGRPLPPIGGMGPRTFSKQAAALLPRRV